MSDTSTHRTEEVHIDEQSRRATGTVQWLLEHEHAASTHPITPSNGLQVHLCGERSFEAIAQDIEAAQDSIDLICWGFDPGMELVRKGHSWPRGSPYGSLLHAAASRGVKVRLLVWHEPGFASKRQNNMPGLTGDQRGGYLMDSPTTYAENMAALGIQAPTPTLGGSEPRSPEQLRHDFCVQWWRDVKQQSKNPKPSGGIEFRTRLGANTQTVRRSLSDEPDKPSSEAGDYMGLAHEKKLVEDHATHHQKTVLIDYAWNGGEKAVGYVMGLNSVTDYWDTTEHLFDTPLRETDWARSTATAQALPQNHAISRDPFQDYACRIVGPALRGVHKNFVDAWQRAGGKARADDADVLPAKLAKVQSPYRAQIVRTQPQEGDKTIKDTYFHAPQFARNYIYIENQYFFYESWVRNLKDTRANFMQWLQNAGKSSGESPLLHLFAVIPWPEDDGMVPRTYDMVKSLGEGTSMPNQHQQVEDEIARHQKQQAQWDDYMKSQSARGLLPDPDLAPMQLSPVAQTAQDVQAPTKNHTTGELESLGLKVLIGRLTTFNRGKPLPKPELNYRQVYIHSKLMVIDDSFFTLGSANLNQRSMAADSELNIATDDHRAAADLRQRVWMQHAGGHKETAGGCGDKDAIATAFGDWRDLMKVNKKAMKDGRPIVGYLVPFQDERRVNFRHG